MKYLLAAAWSFFAIVLHGQPVSPGESIDFNRGWKFSPAGVAAAAGMAFSDSAWRTVDLPHDFSIEGKFDSRNPSCAGYLPGGIGWYRKTFRVPMHATRGKIIIRFDAVYKNSEVWINGHYLGKHSSGYTSFEYDLTPWINQTGENCAAVKTDHEDLTDSGWYTGSGIIGNVSLKYTGLLRLAPGGVFAETVSVSTGLAKISVMVRTTGSADVSRPARVKAVLLDPQGRSIPGAAPVIRPLNGTGEQTFHFPVANPVRWSVNNPALYSLHIQLYSGKALSDEQKVRIGIRKIRFDASRGFFLNDSSLKLKGVCMLRDAGTLGSAVPKKVWEMRLDVLKRLGCNAIRACHNPHSTDFLDACDEKGFLVISEAFDEWEEPKTKWIDGWNVSRKVMNGYSKYFRENGEKDLRDQLFRDRNHPSIIMWSIGNEIDFPNDPYTHPILDSGINPQQFARFQPGRPRAERLAVIAARLIAVVKSLDDSRPVTAGLASALMAHAAGYAQQLDVIGYNYQEYLFPQNHTRYPGKAFYASETGHRLQYWDTVTNNAFVAGQFLWSGFEYLGESFQWPRRTNPFGLIDLAGHFKPEAFFRQSLWSDSPMIYIGCWDTAIAEPTNGYLWDQKNAQPVWNWKMGLPLRVSSFSNCDEVELFLNGMSLGKQTMKGNKDRVLNWLLSYQPGTLVAVGTTAGKSIVRDTLQTATAPARIRAFARDDTLRGDKRDVTLVEISLLDSNGHFVYRGENPLTVSVKGELELLGIENANPTDTSAYRLSTHAAYHGRLIAYVKATGPAGHGVVMVNSPGLQSAEVNIVLTEHIPEASGTAIFRADRSYR